MVKQYNFKSLKINIYDHGMIRVIIMILLAQKKIRQKTLILIFEVILSKKLKIVLKCLFSE